MPAVLLPNGKQAFVTPAGVPAVGYKVATFAAGTNNPQTTWADALKVGANANPVILDARGEAAIFWDGVYKVQLQDPTGTPVWTIDNINSSPAPGSSSIPTVDNVFSLGSVAFSWANLYLGANHTPVLDVATGIIGSIPRTAAEITAGVTPTNPAYPPYDIRRYGGDPTGAAASDTALVAVLAVCGTPGGTIRFPNGTYKFANQYSLSNRHGIVFQGDGGPTSSNTNGTILTYSGTVSPWFSCPQASGVLFKNMTLAHSNVGFTGTYIKYGANAGSPASFCGLDDVAMGASVSNTTHLDLDATITFSAKRCLFQFGNPSVKGQASGGGSYANVVNFDECEWSGSASVPVQYGGFSWSFDGCVFEQLTGNVCGAFSTVAAAPCQNLSFRGCWFGDATTGGTWITFYGEGLAFLGNWIAGNVTATAFSLNAATGVEIIGNYIAAFASVIDFTTAPIKAVELRGNSMSGLTAVFTTTANTPANLVYNPNNVSNIASPLAPPSQIGVNGANGWHTDENGIIEQWGSAVVTTGTPLPIVFTKQFPTAVWNIQLTTQTPVSGANTVSVTVPTTAGFTLNAVGVAGTNPTYWRAIGN